MSAMQPVQEGVHSRLVGFAGLMALVTGVFDDVQEGTAYPYVTIGEWTENPAHTHDKEGWELTGTLHIWDDQRGFKRAQLILAQMDLALLHHVPAITGWGVRSITREFTETLRHPDGERILRHVVTRWRVRVLEA